MIVPAISWNYYEQRTNKTLFEYKEYQRNDYFPMITSDSIGSSFEQKTELILISENRAIVHEEIFDIILTLQKLCTCASKNHM